MIDDERTPDVVISGDYHESRDRTDSAGSFSRWVRLGEIMPSEQNPRQRFEHIDELAHAIKATGGEPINPLVVVRDANRYRIVDGERRYRAMRKLHDDDHETHVLVFDSYSDAAEIVAMLATDSKDALSEDERALGFQTAMVLNVPYEKISDLTGYDVEVVRKADAWRRGYEGNIPSDVPLDLMVNIAEAGIDAEATERVLDSDPNQRPWQLQREQIMLERARAHREALAWLEASGLDWSLEDDVDDRDDFDQYRHERYSVSLEVVRKLRIEDEPDSDDYLLVLDDDGTITVYKRRGEGESEAARARAEAEAVNDLVVRAMRDLMAHVLEDLKGFEGTWYVDSPAAEPPSELCANLSALIGDDVRRTRSWFPDFAEGLQDEINAVCAGPELDSRELVARLVDKLHVNPYWGYSPTLSKRDASELMRITRAAIDGGHDFERAYLEITDHIAEELGYDGSDWRDQVTDEG